MKMIQKIVIGKGQGRDTAKFPGDINFRLGGIKRETNSMGRLLLMIELNIRKTAMIIASETGGIGQSSRTVGERKKNTGFPLIHFSLS